MLKPPFIVSSVEQQKKNPSRCSVLINGEFAFGCVMDLVLQFRLVKGRELTAQELKQLEEQEDVMKLKQTALRYATYKSRTAHEVRRKILEKEYSPDEAEFAVQFLASFGYVNDAAYARNFIQEYSKNRPSGVSRLKQELRKRGISEHDAVDALSEAFPAETAIKVPAFFRFSIAVCIRLKLLGLQPSAGGQPQELAITCGAIKGFGFKLLVSVGAKNHSKHSK